MLVAFLVLAVPLGDYNNPPSWLKDKQCKRTEIRYTLGRMRSNSLIAPRLQGHPHLTTLRNTYKMARGHSGASRTPPNPPTEPKIFFLSLPDTPSIHNTQPAHSHRRRSIITTCRAPQARYHGSTRPSRSCSGRPPGSS